MLDSFQGPLFCNRLIFNSYFFVPFYLFFLFLNSYNTICSVCYIYTRNADFFIDLIGYSYVPMFDPIQVINIVEIVLLY